MPAQRSTATTVSWRNPPEDAPLILVLGPEDYLAARAMDGIRQSQRRRHPDVEVNRLDAAHYAAGELLQVTSPSLFGENKLVEVVSLATMNDAFLQDGLAYLQNPDLECCTVFRHEGGNRGKKLLDAIKAAGVPVIECQPLKRDAEKIDFVRQEFAAAKRRIDPEAVRALVAATGSQLGDLATACQQLIADVEGAISGDIVNRYYGGRVEATAFRVADAAVAGQVAVALSNLRHAIDTGVDPVPMVAAIAMKLRAVARVYGMRGSSAQVAKELGMAPWQVDQARREAERWSEAGIARALRALAEADAGVKGAGRDPVYAVERAVTTIALAARDV